MTYHLFGNLITARGIAANNRGETEGNCTTLPKVFWGDKLHVSVSAEAIRWAIRYYWQVMGIPVNRQWIEEDQDIELVLAQDEPNKDKPNKDKPKDEPNKDKPKDKSNKDKPKYDPKRFIDDDVMGFMDAKPGKGNEAIKRRGALEVTRAVSLQSAEKIEITFNSRSGKKPKKGAKNQDNQNIDNQLARTSIYSTETITTRFQYGLAITPERLTEPKRILNVVEAVTKLANVGGNHARFLFDFSPESAIFRWSHHPVPQILHCFEQPEADILTAPRLCQLIECEEIPAEDIWIFGGYAFTEEAEELAEMGANIYPSIRKGVKELITQIAEDLEIDIDNNAVAS